MTGQAHWLPLAVLLLAALPALYSGIRSWLEDRKYLVQRSAVRCRARGNQLAQCTVVRDLKTGQALGIRSCSAVHGDACCARTCLPLFAPAA